MYILANELLIVIYSVYKATDKIVNPITADINISPVNKQTLNENTSYP